MKKIEIKTSVKKLLADVYTPVGIYLRLRDRFRDTILLESTDHHAAENSYSFICINAIGGMEISDLNNIEFKLPGHKSERIGINNKTIIPELLWDFIQKFEIIKTEGKEQKFAQRLFGYSAYDAVQFFETIKLTTPNSQLAIIPLMRYRLYQYIIAINHFNDELYICENVIAGLESEGAIVESLIRNPEEGEKDEND